MPASIFSLKAGRGRTDRLATAVAVVLMFGGSAWGQVSSPFQASRFSDSAGYGSVWQDGRQIKVTRWMDFTGWQPLTYEEWKMQAGEPGPFEITSVRESLSRQAGAQGTKFCVLVNTALYSRIEYHIDRYIVELTGEGYDVALYTSSGGTPADLRAFLQTLRAAGLQGCLLVGDFPVAWYETDDCWNPDPPHHEEFPCDLYYMDLDGTFIDNDADGRFDLHSGAVGPEIYLGRLTASTLHLDGANEVSLLKNYFEKNHLYRSELRPLNNRALVYVDDDWAPGNWWSDCVGLAYAERTLVDDVWTTWDTDYESRLPQNYELIQLCAHSDASAHSFASPSSWSTTTVQEMKAIGPVAYFYSLYACSNARFVEADYMAGWYIFGDDYGLAAVSSTKVGGMLDLEYFYGPFGQGTSFGEAFRDWFTYELQWGYHPGVACWTYGMTLVGDPTLKKIPPAVIARTLQCDDGQVEDEFSFPNPEQADLPNVGFTATAECTLSTALVNVRLSGSPGARLYIWQGSDYFPATIIDSVDVSSAALTAGQIDLLDRQIAFQKNDKFHVGFRMLPSSPGDTIWLRAGSFTCSPLQSSVWLGGTWQLAFQVWPGRAIGFMIRAVARCLTDSVRITPIILPDGAVDVPYAEDLEATGGTPPYHWELVAGTIPGGLSLDPATGMLSGTPTLGGTGRHTFTVRATDSYATPRSDIQHLTITVPYCLDTDSDGFGDPGHPENTCDNDNCPSKYNPLQEDCDGDGIGDSCEVIRSWYVRADGQGDALSIQAAIDSCTHRDTVTVMDGVYQGPGNRDLDLRGRRILVRSQNGPKAAIIDCQGTVAQPRRGFAVTRGEDSSCVIDGFTIRGGYGAILYGISGGGAMVFDTSSPAVKNCVFYGNGAMIGGAVFAYHANPRLINCTFAADTALYGAAVLSYNRSHVRLDNCILAFNQQGEAVSCFEEATATLSCSDVYGNPGGDWQGCIAGQETTGGNLSADPLFCNAGTGNLGLQEESPCAPAHNSCSVLIGARDVGCPCECPHFGDLNRDEAINPLDVVIMVNHVYKGLDQRRQIPGCPGDNGDFDCEGGINPIDAVLYVNFVYKSAPQGPCDPCAP